MIKSLDYFASLVQEDEHIPLFEAALSIAQDDVPSLDLSECLLDIDRFAARLKRRMPADIAQIPKLRLLNNFFYQELGFAGNLNDYYNPDNSYLHKVLAARRGIPISLAVIYMELAQQIGLDVKGISFPGHFLMKLSVSSGDIILDPFNGASLSREDIEERLEPYFINGHGPNDPPLASYLAEASPRTILARMLRNLKTLFAEHPHWKQFLNVQQRLVILLPGEIAERRDRGLAFANLDCPQAALQDLEAYLDQCPQATDAESLRQRLPELRAATRRLN
jgi:regulator of sirC expression with transglutaminase-like and TPR domain